MRVTASMRVVILGVMGADPCVEPEFSRRLRRMGPRQLMQVMLQGKSARAIDLLALRPATLPCAHDRVPALLVASRPQAAPRRPGRNGRGNLGAPPRRQR